MRFVSVSPVKAVCGLLNYWDVVWLSPRDHGLTPHRYALNGETNVEIILEIVNDTYGGTGPETIVDIYVQTRLEIIVKTSTAPEMRASNFPQLALSYFFLTAHLGNAQAQEATNEPEVGIYDWGCGEYQRYDHFTAR